MARMYQEREDQEANCEECEEEFPLSQMTCANTGFCGDKCTCNPCELYCKTCFEEE